MGNLKVPTMAEMQAKGETPDVLFWVGCAGSFDDRAKRVTKAIVKILNHAGVKFAVLGSEESCTGDPAKRAGNEFLFQMQAMQNIEVLNAYHITRIVTACPHCMNTIKHEYKSLGGDYEVVHHSELLEKLFEEGKISIEGGSFKGKKITFHDPCYLGRGNGIFDAPREVLKKLDSELVEMKHHRENALCCGGGGAQVFKESEKGDIEINEMRTKEAVDVDADIIATGCPYCNIMMMDGVNRCGKDNKIDVLDIAEMIETAMDL